MTLVETEHVNPAFLLGNPKPLLAPPAEAAPAQQIKTERPSLMNIALEEAPTSYNRAFAHSTSKPLAAPVLQSTASHAQISKLSIPENCGGCGWKSCAHHCAKLFQLEVEVSGLSSEPVVEIPKKKDLRSNAKPLLEENHSTKLRARKQGNRNETTLGSHI